jgi:hypothetical protein
MKRLIALGVAVLALLAAAPAGAATFGRLFPHLPGFTEPTVQQLADLAQTQFDPNLDTGDNVGKPSGLTYFGQFLDHDLTLDTSPQPSAPVDPTTLTNQRTFALDLDSVYGGGPQASPQLYEADGRHFRVSEPTDTLARDLPRNPDGSAIVAESRNDENQIIAQIQVAFLKAHNRLIDEGKTFDQARRILRWHYQKAVVDDFLPNTIQPDLVRNILATGRFPREQLRLLLHPEITTVEFSVAAYRFGHSQVRRAYDVTDTTGRIQVFSPTRPDLRGGRPITRDRQIDWGNFFNELAGDGNRLNISRKIDPLISSGLFDLPIPGAEATGNNVLAFRNMVRAKFYDMPSGQAVAAAMGLPVITPAELNLGPGFENGTPLWYYVLAESERTQGGASLGPVGSRIVGGTFAAVLFNDRDSYVRARGPWWRPDPAIAGPDGKMTLSDLFVFAGVTS